MEFSHFTVQAKKNRTKTKELFQKINTLKQWLVWNFLKGTALNLKVLEKVMESRRIKRAQKENANKVTYLDNRQVQQQF